MERFQAVSDHACTLAATGRCGLWDPACPFASDPPLSGVSPERQRVQHEHPHAGTPSELLQRHPGAGPQGCGAARAARRRPWCRVPADGHPGEPMAARRHRREQEKGRVWVLWWWLNASSPQGEVSPSCPLQSRRCFVWPSDLVQEGFLQRLSLPYAPSSSIIVTLYCLIFITTLWGPLLEGTLYLQ